MRRRRRAILSRPGIDLCKENPVGVEHVPIRQALHLLQLRDRLGQLFKKGPVLEFLDGA
jgi:hypothetical protein